MDVPISYINGRLGLNLSADEMASSLKRMQLEASAAPAGTAVQVSIPPSRSDILHACDIMEDVAIAYGYNNLTKHVSPHTVPSGMISRDRNPARLLLTLSLALLAMALTVKCCIVAAFF